jgi:hypothetical protein
MKAFVSLCLALLLAVTFASPQGAMAAIQPPQDPTPLPCAEMRMAATDMETPPATPPASPDPSSHAGCQLICAVGCAVPLQALPELIGAPIGWGRAFGLPVSSPEPTSATPEAEDPPPRLHLV